MTSRIEGCVSGVPVLPETRLTSPCVPFDVAPEPVEFGLCHQERYAVGSNLVVKRKLHPLLESLGIQRCGLHAFRHTTEASWMGSMHP